MHVIPRYFAATHLLMHSKQIDLSNFELRVSYIMPNASGEHVELQTKKLRVGTDLKLRSSEIKYKEPYTSNECKRMAEYYLSEDLTKMVLDHIHSNANFGTLALSLRTPWQRFVARFVNRKIRFKLSNIKKTTGFVHSLISLHRNELLKANLMQCNEFILCGLHQAQAFEAVLGFRFANTFSRFSAPFGPLFLLGNIRGVDVFVDPNFKSDYIVIGHRPNSDVIGTVAVHTEFKTTTTDDSVSANTMVGFVDFERKTKYHAVAIEARSVYF